MASHIGNQGAFDERNPGDRKLRDVNEAIDMFGLERDGKSVLVRPRRARASRR